MVRVTGFEPAASCSQSRRATNCATPGYLVSIRLVVFSQTTRATNCANPGFLVIQFCTRCGQTCGQAVFLTTSTCGGSACIAGVSRDCGHGIFRLEGGATRSQSKRATNCATPRNYSFLLFARLLCSPGLRSPITPTVYWIFRRKSTAGAPFLPAAKSKGRDLLRSLSLREMFCGFTGGNYLASTSAMWPMRSSSLLL